MHSFLDHITITAPSLAVGIEYVHRTLGVMPQVGGEHPRMGTHNYFLRLGEKVYLEIIAINPNSPRPQRPRWFQLDELRSDAPPRLATWIVRTDDISAVAASPVPLGVVEPMSRGELNWLITIPPDGSLPLKGVAPTVIQWPAGVHPTTTLQHTGCSSWKAFIMSLKRSKAFWIASVSKASFRSRRYRLANHRTSLPTFKRRAGCGGCAEICRAFGCPHRRCSRSRNIGTLSPALRSY